MKVYLAQEYMDEGYDATITLRTEIFATKELAEAWVNEIKSDSYIWRDCEEYIVIGSEK